MHLSKDGRVKFSARINIFNPLINDDNVKSSRPEVQTRDLRCPPTCG